MGRGAWVVGCRLWEVAVGDGKYRDEVSFPLVLPEESDSVFGNIPRLAGEQKKERGRHTSKRNGEQSGSRE